MSNADIIVFEYELRIAMTYETSNVGFASVKGAN